MILTTLNSYEMVGHLPREISAVVWCFLKHKGEITDKVLGRSKRSRFTQGRLEIPARLKLYHSRMEILNIFLDICDTKHISRKFSVI